MDAKWSYEYLPLTAGDCKNVCHKPQLILPITWGLWQAILQSPGRYGKHSHDYLVCLTEDSFVITCIHRMDVVHLPAYWLILINSILMTMASAALILHINLSHFLSSLFYQHSIAAAIDVKHNYSRCNLVSDLGRIMTVYAIYFTSLIFCELGLQGLHSREWLNSRSRRAMDTKINTYHSLIFRRQI